MLTVAALVGGTVVAIGATQNFRSEGIVISDVSTARGSKAADCPAPERGPGISISFFLNRDDTVSIAIVNAENGSVRRVLARGLSLAGGRRHCAPWDGRDQEGKLVPPGTYRLRVSLDDAGRVATAGEAIRVPGRGDPAP